MYLDNAATTPLKPEVKKYIISLLDVYQNPSSMYQSGVEVKQIITTARNNVAKFINANPEDIIFTSGGSASNTLAIRGLYDKNINEIFYSPIAHKSILKCVEDVAPVNSQKINVDKEGFIIIDDLKEMMLSTCCPVPIVVVDYANSEIGTIQNVREIIELVHKYNGIFYLDCTGSISQIPLDVKSLNVDMVGFSAHKIGALKGTGVLYKKPSIKLKPLIYGSQEQGLFGGTENVIGIGALGKAIETHKYQYINNNASNYLYESIISHIPDTYLIGSRDSRLPHNLYLCFKGVQSESLMILLDTKNIQVSTGSACTSGDLTPSATLQAIGINKQDINSCIRISLSGNETKDQLDYIVGTLLRCVNMLRKLKD